jgi:RNA polymerase sigma-70 factor (ECF subfamily)
MLPEKCYEEATILKLLSQDSEYALQLVFDNHRNHIYKVALLYLKSPVLAEEVVQDVFIKLWFHRKSMPEIKCLEAWLHTVSKNLILNYLKKLSHEWTARKNLAQPQNEDNADFRVRYAESNQLLRNAINQLSEQQRTIYTLSRHHGLSHEEIAEKLSISPLTVKTHMARALNAIRSYFQQHGEILPLLLLTINL